MDRALRIAFNDASAFRVNAKLMAIWQRASIDTGMKSNLGIPKDIILGWLSDSLQAGYIEKDQALAILSANTLKHKDSGFDQYDYLKRALKLYNARTLDDVCDAEDIEKGSLEYGDIQYIFTHTQGNNTRRMQAVRMHRYKLDITNGSRGNVVGRVIGTHTPITLEELNALPERGPKPEKKRRPEELANGRVSETTSLRDMKEFVPMMQKMRGRWRMTEAQCAWLLCFFLHGFEERGGGSESYVTHPVAVASLVQKYGNKILKDPHLVWRATLAALLHDVGEHTNFKLNEDLPGLLSKEVVQEVQDLHKGNDEKYFDYIRRIARNPVTALVKLCDIAHNTDGHAKTKLKQDFVYRLAAAYLRAAIEQSPDVVRPDGEMKTVRDFALDTGICSSEEAFRRIENIANKSSPDEKGEGINFKLTTIVNEDYLANLNPDKTAPPYAHPHRDPSISLQL